MYTGDLEDLSPCPTKPPEIPEDADLSAVLSQRICK